MSRARTIAALFALSALLAGGPRIFAATSVKTVAVDTRAWPTAYEPATMTAAELLAAAKRASGIDRAGDSRRVTYDFQDGGLSGTQREIFRGDDYRSDTTVGPFVTADGRYKGQSWEIGENGYLLLKHGLHQRGEANTRALERIDPGEDVQMLGRLRSPADAYVARVAPKDGREELRFYDPASFHLIRSETRFLGRLLVRTYEDYRPVGGGAEAYRITYSDGRVANDEVFTIRSLTVDTPVVDAELAVPSGRRELVQFPNGVDRVRLPARIDNDGAVIVRVDIGGRGYDFQLDSGCSTIAINKDEAEKIGLKTYGKWTETVAGTFSASAAVVPEMKIGSISMKDVAVSVLPFDYQNDESTKVVGLLGFDFIAGGIIKIDYEHGSVDAMRYDTELPKEATSVDAVLDDDVPVISAAVNGRAGDHFILDTGSADIVLFSEFTRKFSSGIKDHSPGGAISREFHVASSEGVGGDLHTQALALERLSIGRFAFTDFLALVTTGDQPAFEGEDTDGLVGASVLSAFDVYLDYANSRVAFVVNSSAKNHRASRGLGSQAHP